MRWAEGSVPVSLALDDGPAGTSTDEARLAATRALSVYQVTIGKLAPGILIALDDAADANTIRWVSSGWDDDYDPSALAVTVTTYDGDSGRITGANIVVNAEDYAWSATTDESTCHSAYDLQDVLTHELGHFFGLGHEMVDTNATMYPTADPCESRKRDLDADDLAGLDYLYVEVGPASDGCAVGGRPRGGALLVGLVLVLARTRRRAGLLAAALFLVAQTADATILVRMPLEKLGSAAGVVIEGKVESVRAVRRGQRVYTDATVTVTGCLRGPCGAEVTVRQLGGEVDGVGTVLDGTASFAAGDEVMLFLRARSDGAFAPVGMAQGAFRTERDAAGAVRAYRRDLRGIGFASEGAGTLERVSAADLALALVPR